MSSLIKLLLNGLSIMITANLVPGIEITNYFTALVLVVVFAILNTFLKPILILFTLPLTILTLGLFTLVINIFVVMLASYLVPEFKVSGILWLNRHFVLVI